MWTKNVKVGDRITYVDYWPTRVRTGRVSATPESDPSIVEHPCYANCVLVDADDDPDGEASFVDLSQTDGEGRPLAIPLPGC